MDIELLKKYFDRWMQFTNKYSMKNKKDEKIKQFLELILKEKEKLSENKKNKTDLKISNDSDRTNALVNHISESKIKGQAKTNGKADNRLQVQTQTIALLKAQLQQKNRMIEELKLNKIVEDTNYTVDVVNDLKKNFEQCSLRVKPKLKCVIGEPIQSTSSSENNLSIQCTKVPKFLQQMEQRARQREEKRKIVTERRKQIEFEKERQKEQMRMEKQIQDHEERTRRINEFKERHKREKLLAIKRKELIERLRALCVMADLHFEKKLMAKYGIATWKLFVIKVKEDHQKAIHFDKRRILRTCLVNWSVYTKKIMDGKILKAEKLYEKKLKIFAFKEMKMMHKSMLCKLYTAEDWYATYIIDKLFKIWKENVISLKKVRKKQWSIAVLHHERWLKWRVIGCWQTLPTIMALYREHEARKERWRLKIQQVLPDFIPRDID